MMQREIINMITEKYDLDIAIPENPPTLSQKRFMEFLNTGLEYVEGYSSIHLQQALENEGYSFSVDQVYDLDGRTGPFDNLIIVPEERFTDFTLKSFPKLRSQALSTGQADKLSEHYIFRDGLEHVFGMDELKPQFMGYALYKLSDEELYFKKGAHHNHYKRPQIMIDKELEEESYIISPTFLRIGIPEDEIYKSVIKR